MTVTTSKGKTIKIDWMYPQRGVTDQLMIGLHDARPLRRIVADFDGCAHFHRASEEEGDMDFDGYTTVIIASRPRYGIDSDEVMVVLSKPEKTEEE